MKISTSKNILVIPNVEKDRKAVEFKLINGVLRFKGMVYSGVVN